MAALQQSAEFQKAVDDSRKLKAKPTNDELLEVGTVPRASCCRRRG